MSAGSRRARIIEQLEQDGSVSVADLVELHEVSQMTIRRDLAELEQQGLLRRFRGGAILDGRRSYEPPYLVRESRRRDEKQRIGAVASELVSDGESVAIDYGTTALEVAKFLRRRSNLSVLTPNLRVALELSDAANVRVILSGGILRPDELALVGREAERTFECHFVDKAIVGTAGIDVDRGLTDFNTDQVAVKQAMMNGAEQVIVVADESKIGVVAFAAVTGIGAVDALVTTAHRTDPRLGQIAECGVEVHIA